MLELAISFPDQSQSFTYGVEFGRILEQLQRGDEIIKNHGFPARIENKKVIEDACNYYGYESMWGQEIIPDGWISFRAIKRNNALNHKL